MVDLYTSAQGNAMVWWDAYEFILQNYLDPETYFAKLLTPGLEKGPVLNLPPPGGVRALAGPGSMGRGARDSLTLV